MSKFYYINFFFAIFAPARPNDDAAFLGRSGGSLREITDWWQRGPSLQLNIDAIVLKMSVRSPLTLLFLRYSSSMESFLGRI